MVDKKRWVFAARIHDYAGAVTAVASVFSNRGVSVEMTLGSTLGAAAPDAIGLFYVFQATEARMKALLRTVARLSVVISVESYHFDSPSLRAVAIARIDPRLSPDEPSPADSPAGESILRVPVERREDDETWLLMAGPRQVMSCLDRLRAAGALADATMTILPIQ